MKKQIVPIEYEDKLFDLTLFEDVTELCILEDLLDELPEGINSLYKVDLSRCSNLRKLEENLFYKAENLTEVLLPEGLTEIAEHAFYGCEKLERIVIPSTVESIADDAFEGCSSLIVADVTRCTQLNDLPDEVEFYGAENVAILLPGDQPLEPDEEDVEEDAETVEINYQDIDDLGVLIVQEGVTKIPNGAFSGCKNLKHIEIPSTVKRIGDYAFEECKSLEKVDLSRCSNLRKLERKLFAKSENLTEVLLPEGLTEIVADAFYYCESLKHIEIPSTVETIEGCAF